MSGEQERLQFGLVPPASFVATNDRVAELLEWLGERAGVVLAQRQVASYDDLARLLRAGVLQVAWLPPILFTSLDVEGVVRELVSAERGGTEPYVAALVARASSKLRRVEDLRGKRVAWVDPLSAAGYVVPRLRLMRMGHAPTQLFGSESFVGSHAAVVRAVLDGSVDVGATYAGFGSGGELVRGAFIEVGARPEELTVVASFGAIPSDVVAVHRTVPAAMTERLVRAFESTSEDLEVKAAVHATFGALRFVQKPLGGHDLLRAEIEAATGGGVISAASAFVGMRPPRT